MWPLLHGARQSLTQSHYSLMRLSCSRACRPPGAVGCTYPMGARLKVYPASKSLHLDFWRAMRAAGLHIEAGWIDAEFNSTGDEPSAAEWPRALGHVLS